MNKWFVSSLFCICIVSLIIYAGFFIYRKTVQESNFIDVENKALLKFNDSKNKVPDAQDLNAKVLFFESKYESVNKRFDDLYVLGSIIVLLLITINVGLFVNTKRQVEDYFEDNYKNHLKKIKDFETDAGKSLAKIQFTLDQARKITDEKNKTTVI